MLVIEILNFEFIWNLLSRHLSGGVLVYWYFAIKYVKMIYKHLIIRFIVGTIYVWSGISATISSVK